jgi:putative acetyltransferase
MRVRSYSPGDAFAMADLYQASVRTLGSADYTAAQVEAWAAAGPSAARFGERMGDGRRAYVAEADDGSMLGFIDLEADGHIDFLYAAPQAKGTGIADSLLDSVEAAARSDGMARMYAEASEAARRFFVRRGFAVLHRRDFQVGGVPIHNYAVEKRL